MVTDDKSEEYLLLMARYWLGKNKIALAKAVIALIIILRALLTADAIASPQGEKWLEPNVSFVGRGPIVPISDNQSIPITSVNVSDIDVDILKANDPATFLNQYYFNQEIERWDLSRIERTFTSVHLDRYTLPKVKTNQEQSARIRLPNDLKPGWYLVVLRKAGSYENFHIRHVLLTDIGVQAKVFQNSVSVRAANLSTGQVLKSGVVKLYRKDGKLFESAAIDENGKATIETETNNRDVIVVETGNSSAILPLREIPLDLSEYAIGGRVAQDESAFIFSNRDLIRPGDQLPINILLRNAQGERLSDIPLTLTLLDARNKPVLTTQVETKQAGYYRYDIQSQPFWNVGRYTLEVRTDATSAKPINVFRFQVEEFTPERMDLTITAKQQDVKAGGVIRYDLEGRYLFGAPANNNELKTLVNYQSVYHFEGKFSDFYVGKPQKLDVRFKRLNDIRLSEQGTATVSVSTPAENKITAPIRVESEFSLFESGGATVQRKQAMLVWKNSSLPAVRPHDKTFAYRSQAGFDLALLNANGNELVAGDLQVKVDYDQGQYYWIYEEGRGWIKQSQDKWKTIVEKTVSVKQGGTSLFEVPVTWGNYRLSVTDQKSGNVTEYQFYAGWDESRKQIQAKPEHLALSLDKTHYQIGDIAKANIQVPVNGSLTLSVESDKELYSVSLPVTKGAQSVEIPMEKHWDTHDMYVSAVLTSNTDGQPIRYMGMAALKIDRRDRELAVDIELPDVIKADKDLIIPVTVSGVTDAEQAWVTLSLVDKGILNLSRFKPRNPYQYFYEQQRYHPDVIDLYSRLYDLRPDPFATSRFGSDSMETEMAEMAKNKNEALVDVKTITLMSQPAEVVNGVANVQVRIPDYNGQVQVIATVFTDEKFGQTVVEKAVAHEVIAELSMPNFFVPGDKSSIMVELFNASGSDQKLDVKLSVNNDALRLEQSLHQTLLLPDQKRYTVLIPVTVKDSNQFVSSTLSLSVNGYGSSTEEAIVIEREWQVPIRPSVPQVTRSLTKTVMAGESFEVPQSAWANMHWVQDYPGSMAISYSPQIDIQRQLGNLFRYPYGCSEQTISKALPYFYAIPQIEATKQQELQRLEQTEQQVISFAVQRLLQRQLYSGAFSLWDEGQEDPWVTVYATDFLMQVAKHYSNLIPEGVLEKAKRRVRSYATRNIRTAPQVRTFAYAAYVSAQDGQLNWSDLNKAWRKYDRSFKGSTLSYMQMIAAFALVGDSERAQLMLNNWREVELNVARRTPRNYQDYGTDLRDNALAAVILDDLIEQNKVHSSYKLLRNKLLETVADESYQKNWFSTQESNALLRAAMVSVRENTIPLNFEVDGEEIGAVGSYIAKARPNLVLKNTNARSVIVSLNAQGYPIDPVQDSTFIAGKKDTFTKTLKYLDGKPYQGEELKVGDRLLVDITIKFSKLQNQDREPIRLHDPLLEDLIPSGFNVENPALNQGPSLTQVLGETLRKQPLSPLTHEEFRNDRYVAALPDIYHGNLFRFAYIIRAETAGEYTVPATKIEAMYNPTHRILLKPNVAKVKVTQEAKKAQ